MSCVLWRKLGGEAVETEEMKPRWFYKNELPFEQMWKSDREWLQEILNERKIRARYTYVKEYGEIERRELVEVEEF